MHKKSLLLVFLFTFLLPAQVMNVVASTSDTVTETPSVSDPVSGTKLADVTGVILLKSQRKKFPQNLLNLFTGSSGKLPKTRKLEVSGDYKGGSVVTVVEIAEEGKEAEYSFQIPIITSVMNTASSKLTKGTDKTASVTMTFSNTNNAENTVNSASHKFLSKATSKRLDQLGSASGSFSEEGAKGRFILKLDFDITE